MDFLNTFIHNTIIRASASTYEALQLRNLGYEMTLNLADKKIRHIGSSSNPIYPEILIWRPDYQGATTGQAVIVEAIETRDTISLNTDKWRRLALLGIKFNLVVPTDQLVQVRQILREQDINTENMNLQTYSLQGDRYVFTTVPVSV